MSLALGLMPALTSVSGGGLLTPAAEAAAARRPVLAWRSCGAVQCADMKVPVDHRRPTGASTTVRVWRRVAPDAAARVGVLVVNPGGPGASSRPMVDASVWPAAIGDRFDLVGIDPRFTGTQAPACAFPTAAARAVVEGRLADAVGIGCAKERTKLANMGADDMARDVDLLRTALGERTISFYGVSWGGELGAGTRSCSRPTCGPW